MAKIIEEKLVISISRLARDTDKVSLILSDEVKDMLNSVITEMAGTGAIVELTDPHQGDE